jgi:predicted DCC family thiol-disulfide oxidoreductase YuxK
MLILYDKQIAVFYDGQCPLCRREINHYQGMQGAETVAWIDITSADNDIQQFGLNLNDAMARFHVLDRQGNWHTGAFGFVAMWRQLSALTRIANLIEWFHLTGLLDRLYTLFATFRLKKRCNQQSCHT